MQAKTKTQTYITTLNWLTTFTISYKRQFVTAEWISTFLNLISLRYVSVKLLNTSLKQNVYLCLDFEIPTSAVQTDNMLCFAVFIGAAPTQTKAKHDENYLLHCTEQCTGATQLQHTLYSASQISLLTDMWKDGTMSTLVSLVWLT